METVKQKPNQLAGEKSPYLLQHAHNPVDWYPWGDEAFEKARTEDKPILLSIGYSTCHWCHVMAEESFANDKIAEIMNRYFVCIKVDREERPDIDNIYITAVSALTGSAGWPLNVFLTPHELKPFFGGTYFPSTPRPGIIAWPQLLIHIATTWQDKEKRDKILSSAEAVTDIVRQQLSGETPGMMDASLMGLSLLDRAYDSLSSRYDSSQGGFGGAPKFPQPSIQKFLMGYAGLNHTRRHSPDQQKKALEMAVNTLEAMAKGGIYDHIGGGFHRYATDIEWHVPHFEKMLYDNAQLIVNYLDAYKITKKPLFETVVKETIDYILRDMTHPDGGFYSAEDADSLLPELDSGSIHEKTVKSEGAFYLWTFKEVGNLLEGKEQEIFSFRYGIKPEGNVHADPSGEFSGRNILFLASTMSETAGRFSQPEKEITRILRDAKNILFHARSKKSRPHLDDKVITAWNGLMISALAQGFQTLMDRTYLAAAEKAAGFIYTHLYDQQKRQLYRIWRNGERKIPGLSEDYAFLIQGLIDLYEASFTPRWLEWAMALAEDMLTLFHDTRSGGFFTTQEQFDDNLLFRIKEDTDSVIPAAGSIAAIDLIRLAQVTDREDFRTAAESSIQSVLFRIAQYPAASPMMLIALGLMRETSVRIIIAGDREDALTEKMLNVVRSYPTLGKTVILADTPENQEKLKHHIPGVANVTKVNSQTTAYVCFGHSCQAPVTNEANLLELLRSAYG